MSIVHKQVVFSSAPEAHDYPSTLRSVSTINGLTPKVLDITRHSSPHTCGNADEAVAGREEAELVVWDPDDPADGAEVEEGSGGDVWIVNTDSEELLWACTAVH
jgi:hypothetical protein